MTGPSESVQDLTTETSMSTHTCKRGCRYERGTYTSDDSHGGHLHFLFIFVDAVFVVIVMLLLVLLLLILLL